MFTDTAKTFCGRKGEDGQIRESEDMEAATATATEAILTAGMIYPILMFMGYAIIFSFLFIASTKRDLKYLRKDYERDLKYLEERVSWDLKRLQNENTELRRELRKSENKS